MIENANGAIVLTAQNFNPSIFTESWLLQHGLLKAEDFVGARIYSPEAAQFQTKSMQVLVIPPKLQLLYAVREKPDLAVPSKMADQVVGLLPETPYQALGINFDYFLSAPAGQEFGAFGRALLGDGRCALLEEFKTPDARFGRYFSKDYGRARLKTSVLSVKMGDTNKEMLHFSFNFHHDIAGDKRADDVRAGLATVGDLYDYSRKLTALGGQG